MARKPSSPQHVRTAVQGLLRKAESAYPDGAHRVWTLWPDVVGPEIARRSAPVTLRRGLLTVAVTSSAWVQQLSFLRERVRRALNEALGADRIREIRFRVQPLPEPPRGRAPAAPAPWRDLRVPDAVTEAVDREVAGIEDPDLRAAVRSARLKAEQVRLFREAREGALPPVSTGSPERGGPGQA